MHTDTIDAERGKPVAKPKDAIVLRPHWQCQIKRDGTRRSRNCCDGSPRSAPALKGIASTYSSCVEQPVQRMFFALAASMGYKVCHILKLGVTLWR